MLYEFETPDGRVIEEPYSMDDAPTIGSRVEINGVTCVRLPSRVQQVDERSMSFTSQQLPTNWPYARHYDSNGSPHFTGKNEMRECLAVANDHGEGITWDGGAV